MIIDKKNNRRCALLNIYKLNEYTYFFDIIICKIKVIHIYRIDQKENFC